MVTRSSVLLVRSVSAAGLRLRTTRLPNLIEDYRNRFLLIAMQARPEYYMTNIIKLGGEPLGFPTISVNRKRLECPPPW